MLLGFAHKENGLITLLSFTMVSVAHGCHNLGCKNVWYGPIKMVNLCPNQIEFSFKEWKNRIKSSLLTLLTLDINRSMDPNHLNI